MPPIPMVIERNGSREQVYDLYSRLLKDRLIMLDSAVTEQSASNVIAQMMFLQTDSPDEDIRFYINSPGGLVSAGMAIYDVMQTLKCDISTVVIGQAMSMGSLLACAGTPGKRKIMPHAVHMIHQPSGGASGTATDTKIQLEELLRWKKVLTEVYVTHTGQPFEKIAEDLERDKYMTAEQCVEYGLVDAIIKPRAIKVASKSTTE